MPPRRLKVLVGLLVVLTLTIFLAGGPQPLETKPELRDLLGRYTYPENPKIFIDLSAGERGSFAVPDSRSGKLELAFTNWELVEAGMTPSGIWSVYNGEDFFPIYTTRKGFALGFITANGSRAHCFRDSSDSP